jgi:hypothetical protein
MNDMRAVFVQGAVCGAFAAAGLMFVLFWHMVTSSANAGALVNGQFQPYQADSSWHIMAAGGGLLLAGGLAALVWTYRKLERHRTSSN